MSNLGFRTLRLVNPYEKAFHEARSAVRARYILEEAQVYSSLPEAIADWLAWYDSLEPLVFTPEEEMDLRDWRRRVKEYTIAHMNEGIGGPGE